MDNRCSLGLLGSSSAASGIGDPWWDGAPSRPELKLGQTYFFMPSVLFSMFTHLLRSYWFFVILFVACCTLAQVFRRTFMHEFHISCSHTEWFLHFL